MIGSSTGNHPMFPVLMTDNQFQYDINGATQLQLFGQFPTDCGAAPVSYMGNEHMSSLNHPPMKLGNQVDNVSRQQNFQFCMNKNFNHDEVDRSTCFLKPQLVSTGLKLSYDDEEPNSSVTSASGCLKAALPAISSLGDNLSTVLDRQAEEFDHYIRLQEEQISKGMREMKQRHVASFLNTIEKVVERKLREKEIEVENMNCRNRELVERIKQVASEVQAWHYRAKYNESVANVLKSNLSKAIAKAAEQGKEGFGDSEVDCTASSYIDQRNHVIHGENVRPVPGYNQGLKERLICRACRSNEVSILLLPCRHLCLCKACDESINVCPICQSSKTTSVEVFMS